MKDSSNSQIFMGLKSQFRKNKLKSQKKAFR